MAGSQPASERTDSTSRSHTTSRGKGRNNEAQDRVAARSCGTSNSYRFCLYPNADYGGSKYQTNPGYTCISLPTWIRNNANSMRNYTAKWVRLWDQGACGGSNTYTAQPHSYDSNFGNNDFSNKANSLRRVA